MSSTTSSSLVPEQRVMHRQLYVAKLGHRIVPIAADGLCLSRSVGTATGTEINDLFEAVLLHIVASLDRDDPERRRVQPPLYDHLPKALASVTGRPLHSHEAMEA